MTRPQQRDGVYQRKDRLGWWVSYISANGDRKREKVEAHTRHQALDALRRIKTAEEKAQALGVREDADVTTEELFDRFKKYQRSRVSKTTYDRLDGILDTLKEHLPVQAKFITRAVVNKLVDSRAGKVKAGTVAKELFTLSKILRLAVDEWELLNRNAAHGVKAPKQKGNGKSREFLYPNELKAALQTAEPWMRGPMALSAITGGRRSEVLGLRWMDVDFLHQLVAFRNTKNGDDRIVKLGEEGMRVISSLSAGKPGDFLFPKDKVDPQRLSVYTRRVFHRLGLSFASFHTLRHTMASWQAMDGEPLYNIQQRLGHKTPRMTMRYAHLAPGYQDTGTAKIDGRMAGVWTEPAASRHLEAGMFSATEIQPTPIVSHRRVTKRTTHRHKNV